jgi:hypothetical protein
MLGGSARRKESSFRSSHGSHFYYVEPKGDEITTEQKTWLRQYINRFEQVLYSDDFKDPKTVTRPTSIPIHLSTTISWSSSRRTLMDFASAPFTIRTAGAVLKWAPSGTGT